MSSAENIVPSPATLAASSSGTPPLDVLGRLALDGGAVRAAQQARQRLGEERRAGREVRDLLLDLDRPRAAADEPARRSLDQLAALEQHCQLHLGGIASSSSSIAVQRARRSYTSRATVYARAMSAA